MKKTKYSEGIVRYKELPEYVEKVRRKCFVCGKIHCVVGGMSLSRMKTVLHKKVQYLIIVHAPLGCWLAHHKKIVDDFYQEKEWYGWKPKKKVKKK